MFRRDGGRKADCAAPDGPPSGNAGRAARALDVFDARILEAVQRNARATADELAEAVGLSAAACQKRVRRLRREGRIVADVAILEPALAAQRITLILHVTLKGESPVRLRGFSERMLAAEEVMQCYRVTGEAHFIVILTVADIAEYEAFCEGRLYGSEEIERLKTAVVRERVKTGFFQPVAPSGGDRA